VGTGVSLFVRSRFVDSRGGMRRWVFESAAQGGLRLRGDRLRRWIGGSALPGRTMRSLGDQTKFYANSGKDSLEIEGN
jgi:hypothetical protein